MSRQNDKEHKIQQLGRAASVLSVLMYVSYIPQIINNLEGNPGSPVQALCSHDKLYLLGYLRCLKKTKGLAAGNCEPARNFLRSFDFFYGNLSRGR